MLIFVFLGLTGMVSSVAARRVHFGFGSRLPPTQPAPEDLQLMADCLHVFFRPADIRCSLYVRETEPMAVVAPSGPKHDSEDVRANG